MGRGLAYDRGWLYASNNGLQRALCYGLGGKAERQGEGSVYCTRWSTSASIPAAGPDAGPEKSTCFTADFS